MKPSLDDIFAQNNTTNRPSLDALFSSDVKPVEVTKVEQKKGFMQKAGDFMTKVAGFTGGQKLAQGTGQALANPQIEKDQQAALNEAINQQGELLKKKKEIQTLGGDTSHIDKGLELNRQTLNQISSGIEGLLNQQGITGKQVAGDVLQLGSTLATAGTLPGVSQSVLGAKTIGSGIAQGAKLGAIGGGAYGTIGGVSEALKQDKTASEIATEGAKGGLIGASTGAVLGGAIGGVTGSIAGAAERKAVKESDFALDLVSPKATEQIKQQALREGRVTEQGLLSAGKITPSKRDIQLAKAVKGVVSADKTAIGNINAISKKVSEINTGVKAYVAENKVPFNTSQLKKQLNNGKSELNLIFASDKQAEKTYNAVVNEFIKNVEKGDTRGLLDARQSFDKIPAIKKLLDSQGLGENTKKEVVLTVRDMANKYIANQLPKGNKYREALLTESRMIEALGNISEKNTDIIGINGLQKLSKKYPFLKYIVGSAVGTGIAGAGAATILGN